MPGIRRVSLLLVRIASVPDRAWSRDELCELLWPGEYVDIARDRLRQTLALLNKALKGIAGESPIFATKTTIRFSSEAEVDTEQFSSLLRQASRNDDDSRRIALSEAVQIGEKPFAEGFSEDWVRHIRDAFSSELHQARIQLAQALSKDRRLDEARQTLEAALLFRPLDEQATLLQIETLCALERRTDAAELIQGYEARLKGELGMRPSARFTREVSGMRAAETDLQALSLPRIVWRDVARPFTRFFGRESELEHLNHAFAQEGRRLVTVTGLGGSGKTRLAVEYTQAAEGFWSQIVLLGLAELSSADQVLHALASVYDVGIQAHEPMLLQLSQRIGAGPTLLVLDNCEHLCPQIGNLAGRLLETCPGLCILATSRILLGLLGEQELALSPLKTPADSTGESLELPAVRMLIERIRAIRPDCQIDEADIPILLQICDLLEGIPLAIELASSRAKVLSLKQMLAGFESVLDLLSSNYSNLPERHRTMRNVLEWSFADLTPDLQEALIDLSVLAGSWTLDAAEAVTAVPDIMQTIEELRSRSLVQSESAEGEVRFRLLEAVRQFAAEKSDQAHLGVVKLRHMKHFADYAVAIARTRQRGDETGTLRLFRLALPDFRLAKQTAFAHTDESSEALFSLTVFLANFYEAMGMLEESARDLKRVLDQDLLPAKGVPYAMTFYSQILCLTANEDGMAQMMPKLQSLLTEPAIQGDLVAYGNVLCNLSFMAWVTDRKDISKKILPQMFEHRTKLKPSRQLVMTELNTANSLYHAGRTEEAIALFHEVIRKESEYGDLADFAHAYLNLGRCYREQGHPEQGLRSCVQALQKFGGSHAWHSTLETFQELLCNQSLCNQTEEQNKLAARLMGFEQSERRRLGATMLPFQRAPYELAELTLREKLRIQFEKCYEQGRSLSFVEARDLASGLGSTK